jgi:transposase
MESMNLGIDVSKLTLDVILLKQERSQAGKFENTPAGFQKLVAWLKKQGGEKLHVCLEATGQYGDSVATYLYQQGYQVSVVNPARIKYYANSRLRRNKTDKADAQLIAQYCQKEQPSLWTPLPARVKDLQAIVRHLQDLMDNRQQVSNRLGSGVSTACVVDSLKEHLAFLDGQIQQAKQALRDQVDQDEQLKKQCALLSSIKGIGFLTAVRVLAEVPRMGDFESARQLAAYAGLTPQHEISGTSVNKPARLSKTGNANLRKYLYMPAISAKKHNPMVSTFCQRLAKNGKKPMEVIGAAMRKLIHIIFGVLKSGRPFDPDFLSKNQAAP